MGQGVGFIIGVRRVGFRGYGFYSTVRTGLERQRSPVPFVSSSKENGVIRVSTLEYVHMSEYSRIFACE